MPSTVLHCITQGSQPPPSPKLQTVRQAILEQIAGISLLLSGEEQAGGASVIQAYHFLPPGFQHHVSLVRPMERSSLGKARSCHRGVDVRNATFRPCRWASFPPGRVAMPRPSRRAPPTQPLTLIFTTLFGQLYPLPAFASKADEAGLVPRRATIHALLGLPDDRPLLRIARAMPVEGVRPSLQVRG